MNCVEYVCEIHPFVRDQICYARDEKGECQFVGTIPLDQLSEFMVMNCYNSKVKKIHLVGPESYIKKFCEDIKYEENCRHGFCDIEIEVN